MDFKGTIFQVLRDWTTGKFQITFLPEQDISGQLDAISNNPMRVTAKQWKEKRSLDANGYYWVLVTKLAEALHIS